MLQNIGLLFQQRDGTLCPVLRAKLDERHVSDMALAVASLNKNIPNLVMSLNDHVITCVEIRRDGSYVRGYAIGRLS